MSDQDSRARQREAESEEERAAALRARLRSGGLPGGAIALCAALGHGPAVSVLGSGAPAGDHLPWEEWSGLLRREDWLALQATEAGAALQALRAGMEELQRLRGEEEQEATPDTAILESITRLEADGEEMMASVTRLIAWDGVGQAPRAERISRPYGRHFWLLRTSSWVTLLDSYNVLSPEDAGSRGYQLANLAKRSECKIAELLVPRLLGEAFEPTNAAASSVEYLEHRQASGDVSQAALELAAAAGHEAAAELTAVEPVQPFSVWLHGLVGLPFDMIRELAFSIALDTGLHYSIGLRGHGAESSLGRVHGDWISRLRGIFLPPSCADDEWYEIWQEERPVHVREVGAWLGSQAEAARESQNQQLDSYATGWRFLVEHIDDQSAAVTISGIFRLWEGLEVEQRGEVEETLRHSIVHDALTPKAPPTGDD